MNKYKIVYWSNGNQKVATVEAESPSLAKIELYLSHSCDDIVSIEVVE